LPPEDDPASQFCLPPKTSEALPPNGTGLLSFLHPLFPAAEAQIYSTYSVITYIKGEVLVKAAGATQWSPAFKGQRIMIGDKIKTTGRGSRASLKFANSAVLTLRDNSQLEIPTQHSGECRLGHRTGYLDMKFGKVWRKLTNNGDIIIKTPRGSTGIRDTSAGHLRGEATPDYSFTSLLAYLDIPLALAADDAEPIVHINYDEDTDTSMFYAEQGVVYVYDASETTSIPLEAGEHISLTVGSVPTIADIVSGENVVDPWWTASAALNNTYLNILYFVAGFIVVGLVVRKLKKRGFIVKVVVVVIGLLLIILAIGFINTYF